MTNDSSSREFEVDSINFAGQTHRWRLSGLLQRGRDRRRDALLSDLALATRFLVVTAKARLVSHCFSISQSLKALLTGLLRLLGKFAIYVLYACDVREPQIRAHYRFCISYIHLHTSLQTL